MSLQTDSGCIAREGPKDRVMLPAIWKGSGIQASSSVGSMKSGTSSLLCSTVGVNLRQISEKQGAWVCRHLLGACHWPLPPNCSNARTPDPGTQSYSYTPPIATRFSSPPPSYLSLRRSQKADGEPSKSDPMLARAHGRAVDRYWDSSSPSCSHRITPLPPRAHCTHSYSHWACLSQTARQ